MRHLLWLASFALGLATSVAAQAPPEHAACRIVGTVATCTNLQPVSEATAAAILTASVPPYVPHVSVPFGPPIGWTDIGAIHGPVFGDSWPFEAAGIYARLFGPARVAPHPRGFYASIPPYVPLTRGWYR